MATARTKNLINTVEFSEFIVLEFLSTAFAPAFVRSEIIPNF